MTKESKTFIENNKIIFRETFNDEQSVRSNGATGITNVTFSKGVVTPSSGYIDYHPIQISISDGYTLRCVCKPTLANASAIFAASNSAGDYFRLRLNTNGSITLYNDANGSRISNTGIVVANEWQDIVVTNDLSGSSNIKYYVDGVFDKSLSHGGTWSFIKQLFARGDAGGDMFAGDVDFVEVYNYALSAEEILNLHNNNRFQEIKRADILDVSSQSGSIVDRLGNSLTLTNVDVVKRGDARVMLYNSTSSVIETTLANDINSVLFWMKPVTNDESIIDLGGGNTITTAGGTLTAAWANDIYVNGAVATTIVKNTWNLITCTVGTAISITDIDIGKISTTFYGGLLNDIRIYEGILVAQECSQAFTNNKFRYGL